MVGLWKNSNFVKKGDAFLVDNKNKYYVHDAIKNGACKIITELDDIYSTKTIKVKSINEYIKNYYDFNNIKLIGITGTNGKTTTCYLIYQMLNMLGVKVAYIGTIGFYINDSIRNIDNTTPSIDILYSLINEAKENNCEVIVMEVSSHALKQDRVYGLLFDAIAVTNITRDHLDYHKTKKDYIKSKEKLTKMLKNKKICVLNKKDKYYKKFKKKFNNNYIIGKDIKIKILNKCLNGTNIILKDNKKYKLSLSLFGNFNIYNFLTAYKIIKELGYNYDIVLNNTKYLLEPVGRMENYKYKTNVIFIDYAHTPDAIKNVLRTVSNVKSKGIITILGAGGNRDVNKRKQMAKEACKYSKNVIFTNDNPRYEDERKIVNDLLKGASGNYKIIYDRFLAIKEGINMLKDNMILMILGKGHEEYQIINGKNYYSSDKQRVLDIINNM